MKQDKIQFQRVYMAFGQRTDSVALSDVSFGIKEGEFVGINGPNGSGKSTMLKLIMGIHKPTSGRVIVNQKIIHDFTEEELSQYRISTVGMVFQDFGLIDFLTVRENIEIPMIIAEKPKEERERRIDELSELLSIKPLLDAKVETLSGGEKQRVSIATGLVNDPEIVLADEPTANIDKEGRKEIIDLFEGLHQRGKTLVMVSHEEPMFRDADRVLKFDKGYLLNG
ncbi:MAG: ABC transporter ATP-binding protein [Methanobacteriota archaeon]|nr:MAG: ABC transporter ATP-binding protein [Euryarchaeota archaeon]